MPHSGHPFLFIINPPIIGEHSLQKIRLHLGHLNPLGEENLYTVFPHLIQLFSAIRFISVINKYLLIINKKKKIGGIFTILLLAV